MSFPIVCSDLSFSWPDGTPVLDGLDLAFGTGRTGLIGVNGSGKSTLLRIITGELTPARGSADVNGEIGYLPQNLPLGASRTVGDLLGITPARAVLHAVERGEIDGVDFDAIVWDVEERAGAELARLGLGTVDLDRTVATLSGGETILVGLAALFMRQPDVLLLDEPTNNLDIDARERLYDAVTSWTRTLVVVSHDRALLDLVDQIVDLPVRRTFGGTFSEYEEVLAVEREAAERMVRAAEGDVRRQKRELAEARTKLDRRVRYGKKMYDQKREPKIIMQERKRQAQVSAGKHRSMHEEKLSEARDRLTEAEEAVRDDAEIRVKLPRTEVPAGRTVLTVTGRALRGPATAAPVTIAPIEAEGETEDRIEDGIPRPGKVLEELVVRGPERIALLGANGSGKTTLLRRIAGELDASGLVQVDVPVRYLPQRLDVLDDSLSILENARAFAPTAPVNTIRAQLARFLFRGDRVEQAAGTLSGGERFRAVLAALLLAEPAPQLLLLDEPTNNLDLASVRQLSQALAAYRGALLVAGHDLPFLRSIGVRRWLRTDRDRGLVEIDAP
ncbi:ABC-F family ATP-binding cassette domain-containing protein [Microtetraspora sp. AC03309]|uniref:ABC-F family ATP-binding cassette domain-containing protein n=1 Tax=Microtetraspora sp. AC03309 TaxID=2779376 RepID=UPI001E33F6BB|nr:ABC-F family ATP-binding cassette domain-containing protein [Microtetraspora sp. AC03309]MCC5577599.1 ABC-F family ATP-binding cassette domain-containing protein [Microtetraspora sp. AC03309]